MEKEWHRDGDRLDGRKLIKQIDKSKVGTLCAACVNIALAKACVLWSVATGQ